MKFVLCGHTGSINRGSDAIVKATADLIHECGGTVVLASYYKKKDAKYGFAEFDKVISYANFVSSPFLRFLSILFILLKKRNLSVTVRQIPVVSYLKNNAVSVSVGGDTYCYKGIPWPYIKMNLACKKKKIPSILWACSVEKETFLKPGIKTDFENYQMIFTREIETYNSFVEEGFSKEKLIKMCDPAFTLIPEKVEMPKKMSTGRYVGVNISPIAYGINKNPEKVKESFRRTIQYILDNSNDIVLLIPHVYDLKGKLKVCDLKIHREMYVFFKDNPYYSKRVICIDKFYNSRQLKYIISQCRLLIACRTHASIAGYSSFVPTLVIGYSVKAVGIAKDLFGTSENYVVMAKDIKNEDDILNAYKWLNDCADEVKEHLYKIIPSYKQQAKVAAKFLVNTYTKN